MRLPLTVTNFLGCGSMRCGMVTALPLAADLFWQMVMLEPLVEETEHAKADLRDRADRRRRARAERVSGAPLCRQGSARRARRARRREAGTALRRDRRQVLRLRCGRA